MKKTFIVIMFLIIFLLLFFLQSNFFSWYNIAGIKPNLFIIYILVIGLFLGRKCGFAFGIIFGLLLDFFVGKRIGFNAISLGITGIIGGAIDKSFSKESRITFMIMTIVTTILSEIISYTLQIILIGARQDFSSFMKIVCIESLFNSAMVIILYPLIQNWGNKIEEVFNEKKSLMRYY